MRRLIVLILRAAVLAVVLFLVGCAKKPPSFTAAEGSVKYLGQPLAHVQVQFIPMLADFGAEFNSVGITDENGHFTLSCGDQPGAAVCKHRVVIAEGPLPAAARGQTEKAQATFSEYMSKLKNRPIPAKYATVSQTPLEVEVSADKSTYDLELSR